MKKLSKKWWVLVIILIIVLVAIVAGIMFYGKDSESSAGGSSIVVNGKKIKLADCTSTASAQPQKYPGWKTSLYATPLKSESSNSATLDNGVRTFSIKSIKDKTSPNSLYFRIEKADASLVAGSKQIVELCNKDNKTKVYETTATTTTTPASADASAVITYLHGGLYYLEQPGDYRADAYIYVDGAWHFTDRINKITLTN